jgi:hypothetical protein
MTRVGAYAPREPGSLKDAEAALVKACGGLDRASALTRVKPTQMHRYTAPGEPDCHMPADVIAALELHCGAPIVTRFLALGTGSILVTVPGDRATGKSYLRTLAKIGRKTGVLSGDACDALADGTLTGHERAAVRADAIETIAALSALLGELEAGT